MVVRGIFSSLALVHATDNKILTISKIEMGFLRVIGISLVSS
jgi:hypothetical protein